MNDLQEDKFGHIWDLIWEESEKLHPGFGTYGGYAGQCNKCGMYNYEFIENEQYCGLKIREFNY